jgi:hypothetical protein
MKNFSWQAQYGWARPSSGDTVNQRAKLSRPKSALSSPIRFPQSAHSRFYYDAIFPGRALVAVFQQPIKLKFNIGEILPGLRFIPAMNRTLHSLQEISRHDGF